MTHGPDTQDTMISLDRVTKRYPGQEEAAVAELTLDIPRGDVVTLVGPSGCGKSTTLRLINRLIEPSGGRIYLDGEDVTDMDADQLRRRMGYVIQQLGLFPHMTVAENIAVVPRILGWDKERIAGRVDELLEMVSLDPGQYRDRYPKELSGGQNQRVGVSRAMAADPPVLLMDEPFGAIDPITRESLQDEFLRLQEDIQKTIIFVTHDIDEAVKMGDRIVLLRQGGHIAQYDRPEHVLTAPADDFVRDFIGSGSLLKGLNLLRVEDVEPTDWPVAGVDDDPSGVRRALAESDRDFVLLLDEGRCPRRWIGDEDAGEGERAGVEVRAVVRSDVTLFDALNEMLRSQVGMAVVADRQGAYQGVVHLETILGAVQRMRETAERHGAGANGDAGAEETGGA
jgi:osmoprotectant transport system ATP-binding protein